MPFSVRPEPVPAAYAFFSSRSRSHRKATGVTLRADSKEGSKRLAPPVWGGMVSPLLFVLVVPPVPFLWLRERELRKAEAAGTVSGVTGNGI